MDEILAGSEKEAEGLSYSKAGIDLTYTDTIKKEMAKHLETKDNRVLNGLGPFASLYDISFPDMEHPVLVLKSEEPGVYVLTSSIAGIVEKSRVIDGSAIEEGDVVLAVASNGLHTNGYSLVRLLMGKMPQIKLDRIDGLIVARASFL